MENEEFDVVEDEDFSFIIKFGELLDEESQAVKNARIDIDNLKNIFFNAIRVYKNDIAAVNL